MGPILCVWHNANRDCSLMDGSTDINVPPQPIPLAVLLKKPCSLMATLETLVLASRAGLPWLISPLDKVRP